MNNARMAGNQPRFTPEELALIRDTHLFHVKARAAETIRAILDAIHTTLQVELKTRPFLTPPDFDPAKYQFVKGEHLEDFPYQYLDFPKHFVGDDKFTFRSLFWWGHHTVFALLLEGRLMKRYKKNIVDRFQSLADRGFCLSLAPTLWEWKTGEGYTLPITRDRKSQMAAVLADRSCIKVARFVPHTDRAVEEGRLSHVACETWRALLPIIAP
jgi:hypothetical protein